MVTLAHGVSVKMGIWEWVIGFSLKRLNKIKLQKDTYGTAATISNKLKRKYPGAIVHVNDNKLYFINTEEMREIQQLQFIRLRKWVFEKFDCDDFSYVMKGIMSWFYGGFAFGIVKVKTGPKSAHQLNCFINEFGKLMFVEPQTNEIFSPDDRKNWEIYWIDI
jgi:hypothetical protein